MMEDERDPLEMREAIDQRLMRFEDRLDQRLTRLEARLENRAEWEKQIELRVAALEGSYRLAAWALGVVASLLIAGGLGFVWALLTDSLRVVSP